MPRDTTFLLGALVIFLLLSVVPNMIQRRRHDQELAAVHRGDWVVTVGGLIGQVKLIDLQEAKLQISATGEITIIRQAIRGRIAPRPGFGVESSTGQPAAEDQSA